MKTRHLAFTLILVLLAGCAPQPARRADVIIPFAHTGGSALAVAPDSRTLASGGWSGHLRLWALEGGREVGGWRAHTDSVNAIHFLDGTRLLTAGYDGRIRIWDRGGRLLGDTATTSITAATVDERTERVLTGHGDGTLRLWALDGLKELAVYRPHAGWVRSVAMDRDGRLAASSATDTRVALIDLETGSSRYLEDPPSDARTLAFSPDGGYLVGGGWFDLFRWPLPDGRLEVVDTEHRGIINQVRFMPDGKRIASISRQTDSAVLLIDPLTGATEQRLQPHELCGVAVVVSPDGRFLATTSDDASVRIWDLRDE